LGGISTYGISVERARAGREIVYHKYATTMPASFDGDTNDSALVSDKPIQRRRKIGEIEQNGYTAVGL